MAQSRSYHEQVCVKHSAPSIITAADCMQLMLPYALTRNLQDQVNHTGDRNMVVVHAWRHGVCV